MNFILLRLFTFTFVLLTLLAITARNLIFLTFFLIAVFINVNDYILSTINFDSNISLCFLPGLLLFQKDSNPPQSSVGCSVNKEKLDPYFITGFVDAEGCFMINISESKVNRIGWRVATEFSIGLH